MYNSDLPSRAELPTSQQLRKSTFIAAIASLVILITVVLPSEYSIDPTGIGRAMGLTQMGEIKAQLAEEAAADAKAAAMSLSQPQVVTQPTPIQQPTPIAANPPAIAPSNINPALQNRTDQLSITLAPGQGTEVKMVMKAGAQANFSWTANGSILNYDTHGDGGGQSVSYEKGRGVASDNGTLVAAFDGNHGWFWRNRTEQDVTVTLNTQGDYVELNHIK